MVKSIQPLLSVDFNLYDTTPDGRLFLGDFSTNGRWDESRFSHFVLRYIHTEDKEVRNHFLYSMEYPLWQRVRKRIQEISKEKGHDKILKERLDFILKYEFPTRKVRGSTGAQYGYDNETEDRVNGDSYQLKKQTHSLNVSGSLGLEQPIKKLLYTLGGSFDVGRNFATQRQTFQDQFVREEKDFLGATLSGYTGLRTREEDKFQLGLSANGQRFFEPPNDHLLRSFSVFGSTEARDIAGKPFSMQANGDYSEQRYTPPPPESGFFHKKSDSKSFGGEASYQFPKYGLVLDGFFSSSDYTESYSVGADQSFGFASLLQYTRSSSYVRAGVGYEQSQGDYLDSGDDTPIFYDKKKIRGKFKGEVRIKERWAIENSSSLRANKSDGTFVGWYPSWDTSFQLLFTPKRWTNSLSVDYGGSYIDLNEYRMTHSIDVTLDISYRPSDWLKISFSPSASYARTKGYEGYERHKGKMKGSLSYHPSFLRRMWVAPWAGISLGSYEEEEGDRADWLSWWAGASVGLDI